MIKKWLNRQMRIQSIPLGVITWIDRMLHLARIGNRYPLAASMEHLSCKPLLIVSAGRSGTTLLRSMLVAGGKVSIPPETQVIPLAARRFSLWQSLGWEDLSRLVVSLFVGHPLFKLWEIDPSPLFTQVIELPANERNLARLIDLVFAYYRDEKFPAAELWGDQSPINTLYLSWVASIFPQARYVHLLRDGRDAISSMVKTGRTTLEPAVRRWVVSVKQAQSLQKKLPPDQFLELRYEALVTSPKATLEMLCSFLEVRYTSQMLEYWRLPTTVEHRHHEYHKNLGRPVFNDSIGRWKDRLSPDQQAYIFRQAGNLLQDLGYD